MDNKSDIIAQLEQMRQLYANAGVTEGPLVERYAWTLVKVLGSDVLATDSVRSRQYLAEYMRLPIPRPSRVHSAILGVACGMAARFADFRFIPFLQMWDVRHLRPEDFVATKGADGKAFQPLAERMTRRYMHAILLRPFDQAEPDQVQVIQEIARKMHYHAPRTMLVTSVTKGESQGRTIRFAHLVDACGTMFSCEIHNLQPHPLAVNHGDRHYVNVGQLYDVLPRESHRFNDETQGSAPLRIEAAYESQRSFGDAFPCTVGYVKSYDATHDYYHIYDAKSRHFVAKAAEQHLGRFGQPVIAEGDYIRFAPIIPQPKRPGDKVFKSAYVVGKCAPADGPKAFGLREAKVLYVDNAKGYYRWELTDTSVPIVEEGTTTPSCTGGFVGFGEGKGPHAGAVRVPAEGQTVQMVVFLVRGKDRQKRPHVVHVEDASKRQ